MTAVARVDPREFFSEAERVLMAPYWVDYRMTAYELERLAA